MKFIHKILVIATIVCLAKANIDQNPIPISKRIMDIGITEGDMIKFPIGGYIGGANTKYSISASHSAVDNANKGIGIIQRTQLTTTLQMKDAASQCTFSSRISDFSFYVLCDKATLHYVNFKENTLTMKREIDLTTSWSRKLTANATEEAQIEKCYDMVQYQSRAIVVCKKVAANSTAPNDLLFSFINQQSSLTVTVPQKAAELFGKNLKLTVVEGGTSGNHLILRQRFPEGTPTNLHRSFKIWSIDYNAIANTYSLGNEYYQNISALKQTALATSGTVGTTIDVRQIEAAGNSGSFYVAGTDYITPPGSTNTTGTHNAYRIYRYKLSRNAAAYTLTPFYKGNMTVPFEKDEVIDRSTIRIRPVPGQVQNTSITIVTKTRFYQGVAQATINTDPAKPDMIDYIEGKKAEFLCGSNTKNTDKSHLSDIQMSSDGRGLFIAVHFGTHEQSETLGLLDTSSYVYDCVDNTNKNGYEVLTDYNTLIIGLDRNIQFYDVSPTPYMVLDYKSISQNTKFVADKPTQVTLTATNKIEELVNRKGEIQFMVSVYSQWSSAAIGKAPFGGGITAYENTWAKLPFSPTIIRANNPTITVKDGANAITDAAQVRVDYQSNTEVKLSLLTLTGDPDQILSADENTFVAVKNIPNGSANFWVFDCDYNSLNNNTFECQASTTAFVLANKDEFIKHVSRLDKFIVLIIGSKKNTKKFQIRYIDDFNKKMIQSTAVINTYLDSPIVFNNKGYAYLIYIENDATSGSGKVQNDRRIVARKFYVTDAGIPMLENANNLLTPTGLTLCPQELFYDSNNTPDQYRTIIIKSHCLGQRPKIVQYRFNDGLSTQGGVILKSKEINDSAFNFCPTGDEGLMFFPLKRKLTGFSYTDESTYDYNLLKIGMTEPLIMNCISQKNVVQIAGRDTSGNYMLINFIGGALADPTRRVHSVVKLDYIPTTSMINGIATAFSPYSHMIHSLVSYTGTVASGAKRFAAHVNLNGPEVYYKVPASATKTNVAISLEFKTVAGTVVNSVCQVVSAPRKDQISIKVNSKAQLVNGIIDIDKAMTVTGHITGGVLSGPADIVPSKIKLASSRKMKTHGFMEGTGKNFDQIEVQGKWLMGVVKGKSIDFVFDPTQAKNNVTDVSGVKTFDNLKVQQAMLLAHPTEAAEALAIVKVIDAKLERVNFQFYRLYLAGNETQKRAITSKYTLEYSSYGTFVEADFQVSYVSEKELYLVQVGAGGNGFTFTKFKKDTTSVNQGFLEMKDANSPVPSSIGTEFDVTSFTSVWVNNYLLTLFTSEEIDVLGFVIYTRGSTPIAHRVKVHDTKQISPRAIECHKESITTKTFSCFIDTVGDADYLLEYTVSDLIEAGNLFKTSKILSKFWSPPGFTAIKIDRTKTLAGVLFKNSDYKKSEKKVSLTTENNRLFSNENQALKATGKSIYDCEYILSIYKPGSDFAYITFTCDDFGNPNIGAKIDFALETYDADFVWLSQSYTAPIPAPTLAASDLEETTNLKAATAAIQAFNVGSFQIQVVNGTQVDWAKIKFEAFGNDGTSVGGSKSVKDFIDGKVEDEDGLDWLFWIVIVVGVILIIGIIVYCLRGGEGKEQNAGSYLTAPSGRESSSTTDVNKIL